ncbi:MAG TPA: GNAT family N-acetyltransferase [Candidatus Saccharimonadales bacterium]|nr:GNAT family N-acetyltransferase [Candidatus Saccharimonadales bacterium]
MSETLANTALAPEVHVEGDLSVRLLEPDDSDAIFQVLRRASEVQSYVTWTAGIRNPDDVACAIEGFQANGESRYALLEGETLIGYIGVFPYEEGVYGLGYFCDPAYRGSGRVTRAAEKLMEAAEKSLPVDRFALYIADENNASRAVAVRLGFSPTDIVIKDDVLDCTERRYEKVVHHE